MNDSEEKYINAMRAVDNIINFVGTTIAFIFFIVNLLSGNFLIALGILVGGAVLVLISRVVLNTPFTFLYVYLINKKNLLSRFVDEPKKNNNEHISSDFNATDLKSQEIERDASIKLDKQQSEIKKQLCDKEENRIQKAGMTMTEELKILSDMFSLSPGELLIEMREVGIYKVNESDTINSNELKIIIKRLSDNGNTSAQYLESIIPLDKKEGPVYDNNVPF